MSPLRKCLLALLVGFLVWSLTSMIREEPQELTPQTTVCCTPVLLNGDGRPDTEENP